MTVYDGDDERHSVCLSGVEAVRMLFAGDAMVTQTVSVFDMWHSKVVLLDRAPRRRLL